MIAPAHATPGHFDPHRPHHETDSSTDAPPDCSLDCPPGAPLDAPVDRAHDAAAVVPLLSPDQIHGRLEQAFRDGNRARLRFVRLLHALASSRLFVELHRAS